MNLKRIIRTGLVIFVALLIVVGPVLAAYTDCAYYCTVTVTNTGTAKTNQRVTWVIDASTLVTNSYMQADGDDAYFVNGGSVRALTNKNLTNIASVWGARLSSVPVGATSSQLYVNSPADTRDAIWVADDGDSCVAVDDASLDIQNLLTLSSNVYLYAAPGAEQTIISKASSYQLYVNATDWGIRIYGNASTGNGIANANGAVQNTPSAGTNWQCIDEAPPLGAGADGDFVINGLGVGNTATDYYDFPNGLVPAGSYIESVDVYYRAQGDGGAHTATPMLKLGVNTTTGTHVHPGLAFGNYNEILTRPGGGNWSVADIDALQFGIALFDSSGVNTPRCSQIYIVVTYYDDFTSETPITVTNAWVNIKGTWSSGANELIIYEGVTTNTEAPGAGNIAVTASDVYIGAIDADLDDVRIGDTALGAPTWKMDLDFEPNQISATVITDGSASTNDVTYTWSALPAGITTAAVGSLTPTVVSTSGDSTTPESPDMVGKLEQDSNMYTGDASMNAPGTEIDPLITQLATTFGLTNAYWVWWLIYAVFAIGIFYWVFQFSHHLFIAGFSVAGWTWFCSNIHIVPFWLAIAMTIIALGLFASDRSPSL